MGILTFSDQFYFLKLILLLLYFSLSSLKIVPDTCKGV